MHLNPLRQRQTVRLSFHSSNPPSFQQAKYLGKGLPLRRMLTCISTHHPFGHPIRTFLLTFLVFGSYHPSASPEIAVRGRVNFGNAHPGVRSRETSQRNTPPSNRSRANPLQTNSRPW